MRSDRPRSNPLNPNRILGRFDGERPGPLLLVVAGIHGNEPAGVAAARRVITGLRDRRLSLAGRFVVLTGNLRALEQGTRFIEKDLNRQWTPRKVEALRAAARRGLTAPEDLEQIALLEVIEECLDRADDDDVYFVDLHTSSAAGCPFVTVGDTLRNRRFATEFPLPLILGLEEQVDGALLEYLNNRGLITIGVEAGHHDAPSSVDRLEAALWMALVATALIRAEDLPDLPRWRSLLRDATGDVPAVIEVRYRRGIKPDDGFRMEPGFTNFTPIRRGRLLAKDRDGEIRAREDGLVLLPLYQGKGNDGFFLAREVTPLWLRVSALLRRLRAGELVRMLPGIRKHPEWEETLVVNTRVARYFPLEVLHLLGYRKLRRHKSYLLVGRRRFDLDPPRRAWSSSP